MQSQIYFEWPAFLVGLSIAAGLIISIGPQNAFVMQQGIAQKHIVPIVAMCVLFDILLISVGVVGFSAFVLQWPWLIKIVAWCGAAFLVLYAFQSYKAVIKPSLLMANRNVEHKLNGAILTTIIVTFLNPCAYLDTVIFLGGISSQFAPDARFAYWLGCITTSAVWFSLLGFLASRLAPFFYRPISWQILNGIVGSTFFVAAAQFVWRFW